MIRILTSLVACFLLGLSVAPVAFGAAEPGGETEAAASAKKKSARSHMLFGQPVNVNIAGGGSLPKGSALTVLNASYADKTKRINNGKGPDTFSQTWLFKFRYGITDHIEFSATTPYINLKREPQPGNAPVYVEGFGDQVAALILAPWNEHQGDPVSASIYAGFFFPTGMWGKGHLPGNGVWGGRYAAGIGAFFPVLQEYKGPAKAENARYEFKIGVL